MNESGVYNENDLGPFHRRIAELRQLIKNDEESKRHPKAMIKLLERQLKDCGMFLHFKSNPTLTCQMRPLTTFVHRCNPTGATRIPLGHLP